MSSELGDGWHGTIVLAHFCEVHGPSVVYCTQMFAESSQLYSVPQDGPSRDSTSNTTTPTNTTHQQNQTSSHGEVRNRSTSDVKNRSVGSCCDFNESQGYFSYESVLNSYLLSHRTPQQQFYSKIRRACLRSLSCEVSPNREGPLLFCEESDCLYALSYVFRISDSQARGFTRWYSFILLTPDKLRLVSSVRFMINGLKEMIDQLKIKANVVFESERVNNEGDIVGRQFAFPGAPGRFLRTGTKKLRSLTELLATPDLFLRFHSRLSFLLRGWFSHYVEKSLEITHPKASVSGTTLEDWLQKFNHQLFDHPSETLTDEDINKRKIEFQIVKDLIETFAKSEKLIETYRNLGKWLGPMNMRNLIYNIVTGNQVIVQAASPFAIIPIMRFFQELIPVPCCSIILYSEQYKDRWECNLLGITASTYIPSNLAEGSYILLMITDHEISYHDISNGARSNVEHAVENNLGKELETILLRDLNPDIKIQLLNIKKKEWINKAKTFYWLSKKVEKVTDSKVKTYLKSMNLTEADLAILRFWITGTRSSDFICQRIFKDSAEIPLSKQVTK
eukprot:TRINITY_DN3725_c0_g1_i1.p1 TRINITY_DN3725_c0_g1~~TRINITY_DN3725_c0_g1_i1.p1  ORF type:complete len:575 (+),score=90.75 TRINITY_DN3725_c0_g1_i1:38-1726(+)